MKGVLAGLALMALSAGACAPALADDYSYHRTVDSAVGAGGARTLTVHGYNGNIRLYGDSGSTVRIHAVLGARTAASLEQLRIQTSRQGNTVLVQEQCAERRQLLFWTFKDCDIELDVHYPRSLAVDLRSENGNVSLYGAASDISITNTNGNVEAFLASPWRGSSISMHNSAGNVDLHVPKGFTGTFKGSVKFGDVSDDAHLKSGPVSITLSANFGDVTVSRE